MQIIQNVILYFNVGFRYHQNFGGVDRHRNYLGSYLIGSHPRDT